MGTMVSQIASLTTVYSTVYSGADQRKHQSSMTLAFVRGIHRGLVNSPHKWPVTRKMFPFDDVIMMTLIHYAALLHKEPCSNMEKFLMWNHHHASVLHNPWWPCSQVMEHPSHIDYPDVNLIWQWSISHWINPNDTTDQSLPTIGLISSPLLGCSHWLRNQMRVSNLKWRYLPSRKCIQMLYYIWVSI